MTCAGRMYQYLTPAGQRDENGPPEGWKADVAGQSIEHRRATTCHPERSPSGANAG